ncbi:cation transport protein-domain-containing protein [Lipomyces starkeyi]
MSALRKILKRLRPRVHFLTLHYAYFIGVCFLTSIIFWGASTPARSVRYIDSLFLTISAMTLAGLNTINLSTLNTFQQVLLFFLIILGSAIWVSIAVLLVRRRAFEKRFGDIIREQRLQRRRTLGSISLSRAISLSRSVRQQPATVPIDTEQQHSVPFTTISWRTPLSRRSSTTSFANVRSRIKRRGTDAESTTTDIPLREPSPDAVEPTTRADGMESVAPDETPPREKTPPPKDSAQDDDTHIVFTPDVPCRPSRRSSSVQRPALRPPYSNVRHPRVSGALDVVPTAAHPEPNGEHLHFLGYFGRNSTFHNLTDAERNKLGGVEYRAVCLLTIIVPIYFILWQLLGGLGVAAYIAINKASVPEANGLNPWWTGFFFAISAFNNSGMSLVDANMVPFQSSTYMLLTMGLLILAGNTCYPIFLRFILYTMRHALPNDEYFGDYHKTLQFLLDHPRRCYTNLFQSRQTWWLLCSVIVLNGIDWVAFEVLNIDNPAVDSIPLGSRVLDGLFQALCVRNGGFYVVSISSIQLGMQVIYVVMMYISVYPVVITMRNSNVYEERSLGIYADDPTISLEDQNNLTSSDSDPDKMLTRFSPSGRLYFVRQQLRAQLAYDLWWMALAVIIISIVEAGSFTRDPVTYSAFNIIFETISAYGCVGISTGLPDQLYSFSGGWHTLSKLVLCAVMLRGRHRGLPVAIDKAILLPSEHLAKAEEEDAYIRMERTMSRGRDIV